MTTATTPSSTPLDVDAVFEGDTIRDWEPDPEIYPHTYLVRGHVTDEHASDLAGELEPDEYVLTSARQSWSVITLHDLDDCMLIEIERAEGEDLSRDFDECTCSVGQEATDGWPDGLAAKDVAAEDPGAMAVTWVTVDLP